MMIPPTTLPGWPRTAVDTACCFCIAEFRLFARFELTENSWDLPSALCASPCDWHAKHPHEEHDEMGKVLARLTESWRFPFLAGGGDVAFRWPPGRRCG